jgi:DNA ligase 1
MSDPFKVMLACDADLTKLRFPLYASAKLDGIRATVRGGTVYSRKNKLIPNAYVQEQLGHLTHFDGELTVGEPTSKSVYRDTMSHVMSKDKEDFDLRFYVFDHVEWLGAAFTHRAKLLEEGPMVHVLPQQLIHNMDELLAFETAMLEQGYEGLILRDPSAPYKQGRSTVKEGYLLKLKRFQDDEAVIVGLQERMHNANAATVDETGHTKRSSHAENKIGRGDLGALVVRMGDIEFNIGTGFDDALRAEIWANQSSYLGKIVKFKHFTIGSKDAPRFPVFLGFRDARDMS